jgi:hypothetical protein
LDIQPVRQTSVTFKGAPKVKPPTAEQTKLPILRPVMAKADVLPPAKRRKRKAS